MLHSRVKTRFGKQANPSGKPDLESGPVRPAFGFMRISKSCRKKHALRIAARQRYIDGLGFATRSPVGFLTQPPGPSITLPSKVLTGIAGHPGGEAAIGYAMGARLEYILIPLAFGFDTAIVATVGTNWGAKQYRRTRESA
jgi:hypothetical protein